MTKGFLTASLYRNQVWANFMFERTFTQNTILQSNIKFKLLYRSINAGNLVALGNPELSFYILQRSLAIGSLRVKDLIFYYETKKNRVGSNFYIPWSPQVITGFNNYINLDRLAGVFKTNTLVHFTPNRSI